MNSLTFLSAYGSETRTVEISRPNGGGDNFDIMEDGYLLGAVILYMGKDWTVVSYYEDSPNKSAREIEKDLMFNRRSFTTDDKDAILDRLVEAGMITPR